MSNLNLHSDLLGMALNDYISGRRNARIKVHSPDFEEDEIHVSWYFRRFDEMPEIEQKAMSLCEGKILDAGAGAGSHCLYMQNDGKNVTALDISGGACEVMRMRGIEKVIQSDLFDYEGESFDTLLMLMNGIGICENMDKLDSFLDRLPVILNKNGQFIFDSTNLIYLYQGSDKGVELNINEEYYGQIQFRLEYDDYFTPSFKWLYIDFDTLSWMSEQKGMKVEKIMDGENYHYLARILV